MTTGLPDFFMYNLWANLRLLDACERLSNAQLDATMTGKKKNCRQGFTAELYFRSRESPLCTGQQRCAYRAHLNGSAHS